MKISYAQEMELCKSLLTAHGMNADDAGLLGESVAHSDFTGIYSHGLSRFANIYRNVATTLLKLKSGETPTAEDLDFQTVENGLDGVRFVHAVIESGEKDSAWVELG